MYTYIFPLKASKLWPSFQVTRIHTLSPLLCLFLSVKHSPLTFLGFAQKPSQGPVLLGRVIRMSFSCMFQAECTGCGTTSHDSSSNLFAAAGGAAHWSRTQITLHKRERWGGWESFLPKSAGLLQHTVASKMRADFACLVFPAVFSCANMLCHLRQRCRGCSRGAVAWHLMTF